MEGLKWRDCRDGRLSAAAKVGTTSGLRLLANTITRVLIPVNLDASNLRKLGLNMRIPH
jgi:hypothetical protein